MAERKAYLLRIDPEVWAEVERLAQGELRSVNGQIEYLLQTGQIDSSFFWAPFDTARAGAPKG